MHQSVALDYKSADTVLTSKKCMVYVGVSLDVELVFGGKAKKKKGDWSSAHY